MSLRAELLVLVGIAGMACAGHRARPYRVADSGSAMDGTDAELFRRSDEAARWGPGGPDLAGSLAAAEAVLARSPANGEAAWRVARALFHQTEVARDEGTAELAARCIDAAEVAVQHHPSAASFYYQALCMGARARARRSEGIDLVKRMVVAGERALAADPVALHAGAHRLLGGIYLRAPAWPASVGDLDAALDHLREAVRLAPSWPENHLLLAEALAEDGEEVGARAALRRGLELASDPSLSGWNVRWRRDVERLRERFGEE